MPFTISHVAAVLPFSRALARWQVLSAAIIGSMAPDFGWFMPWRPARFETHSAVSLVTFCLPVGLAAYWVFQRVVKTPLLELLPPAAYARWHEFAAPADYANPLQWILAACGVLVGGVTHLVWDAFTHEGARGVRMIPALDEVFELGRHHLMGSRLLQDVSSLLGLILVVAMFAYSLRRGTGLESSTSRILRPGERRVWVGAYLLMAVVLSSTFFLIKYPVESTMHGGTLPVGGAAIAVLRGLAAALLSVSLCLKLRLRTHP